MFKVIICLCLVATAAALSNRQNVEMCLKSNLIGDCKKFQNDEKSLESSVNGNYSDKVRSVLLTGMWQFYEFPNYNSESDGWVEMYWGKNKTINLPYQDELSSIRHVGDIENMNFPSVTSYLKEMFQGGSQTHTHLMIPKVYGINMKSLIITGPYSWTFYSGIEYSGDSLCLTPMDGQPVLLINAPEELGFTISSIKMGCHADEQRKVTEVSQSLKLSSLVPLKKQSKH